MGTRSNIDPPHPICIIIIKRCISLAFWVHANLHMRITHTSTQWFLYGRCLLLLPGSEISRAHCHRLHHYRTPSVITPARRSCSSSLHRINQYNLARITSCARACVYVCVYPVKHTITIMPHMQTNLPNGLQTTFVLCVFSK